MHLIDWLIDWLFHYSVVYTQMSRPYETIWLKKQIKEKQIQGAGFTYKESKKLRFTYKAGEQTGRHNDDEQKHDVIHCANVQSNTG